MEFRLLGPLEVCADGKLVALGGPKQRAILAVLLLHANEVVPRARLLAEVWGERAPGSEHSLDVHISRLRKALAPGGAGEVLVRRDRGYLPATDPPPTSESLHIGYGCQVPEGSPTGRDGCRPVPPHCPRSDRRSDF